MNIETNTVIQRKLDVIHTDMDGETVMMNFDHTTYYGLNDVGTRIWSVLEEPMTIAEMCQRLCAEFDVSEEECLDQSKVFVEELAKNDFITVVSSH